MTVYSDTLKLDDLHRRYNGPPSSQERMAALIGSPTKYREATAKAMVHLYGSECLRIARRIFSRTGGISIPELHFLLEQRKKWRGYLNLIR